MPVLLTFPVDADFNVSPRLTEYSPFFLYECLTFTPDDLLPSPKSQA